MSNGGESHHALESLDVGLARELEDRLWWVQGRKSIISRHLRAIVARMGGVKSIFDIGCGSGGNLDVLAEYGDVVGIEPSPTLAERARSRGVARNVYEAPAWDLAESQQAQVFTMFDVLEHIEHDAEFLVTLRRHATQRHSLLVSVPACPILFGDHDRLLSHHRRYSKSMLVSCFREAGYDVVSIRYYMFFFFPIALAARLADKLKAFFGFRRASVELGAVPPAINTALSALLNIESVIAERIQFPVGLWLFAVAEPRIPPSPPAVD